MKILGVIPARSGSKGVPGKNIKLLGGKPLLQYTSEVALQSNYLTRVVLSSDAVDIISTGKKLGLEAPFIRPNFLAEDSSPTLPVIKHALDYYKEEEGIEFDAVCLLQVTSPFRTVEFLDKAIEKFIKNGTDSLISVLEVPHEYNPHWTFEVNAAGSLNIATGEKEIIPRRQDLPNAYHRDGSIYLTKTAIIQKQNSLYGKSISHVVSDKENYVNIDTVEDWGKAELIINTIDA